MASLFVNKKTTEDRVIVLRGDNLNTYIIQIQSEHFDEDGWYIYNHFVITANRSKILYTDEISANDFEYYWEIPNKCQYISWENLSEIIKKHCDILCNNNKEVQNG